MKKSWLIALVGVAALTGLLLAPRTASAEATATVLKGVPPFDQEPGKYISIGARLTDAAGKPIGGVMVDFFVITTTFGERPMEVGRAATDSQGVATVGYKPSWAGETRVVARSAGNAQYAAAESKFQFAAVGPDRVHANAEFGLAPIRAIAPVAVFAIVAFVWGVLLVVLIGTVRGLRGAAPEYARAPRLAGAPGLGSEGPGE